MLRPIFDAHSIETISLTLEFSGDVDQLGLSVVRDEASRLKVKLPIRRIMRKNSPPSHDSQGTNSEVRGYLFLDKISEKENNRFEIFGAKAQFSSRTYTNFASFLAEADFSLRIAHEAFGKSGHYVDRIILSYKDEFVSDTINWDIDSAINPDTTHIAKACLERNDFWHSAMGYFQDTGESEPLLLHNIRAGHSLLREDILDGDNESINKYLLTLELFHILDIMQPEKFESFTTELGEKANYLRVEHKKILSDILSLEMAARIGLNKPAQE
ncbi:hypothetical protein F0170_07465 [Pseudomonas sp. MAFF 730085]|uniref:TIGR04255 family protein n=1 Tax=Pseudomonas kitaguniensis TaxID=2607908 RepID=A0A5N7JR99_9PSED|nr:hypothetical protein [Pseudomonas kitaguniensis]MPQ83836.1 hypothetical protein [Pseudomonas kitaguniensis]